MGIDFIRLRQQINCKGFHTFCNDLFLLLFALLLCGIGSLIGSPYFSSVKTNVKLSKMRTNKPRDTQE